MPFRTYRQPNAAARAACIVERQDALDTFERLTGKGRSVRAAASVLGLSLSAIRALQQSA